MNLIRVTISVLTVAVLVGGIYSLTVFAASIRNDGEIVKPEDYSFPSYAEAAEKTDAEKYASEVEYDRALRDKRFKFQKLTYISDGLKVKAYLYKPRKIKGRKYPAVVFNRGSYVRGDIAPELITMFHRLANSGFVVVAPM